MIRFAEFARRTVVLAITGSILACSGDQTQPSAQFAGTYHASATAYEASVFTVTQNGVTTDLLAQGAVLDMTLTDDGHTSGHMFVEGGDEGGADLDVDLAGTWTATDGTVRFDQQADTFIRDIPFTLSGNLLSGTFTKPGVSVHAVLVKG